MYKLICRDLGFDCNFILEDKEKSTLTDAFKEHLKINHEQYYPKNELYGFIENQTRKQQNRHVKNKEFACLDSCETIRLEKWKPGHRNYP
ncbi:hypothetical protein YTPLAS73_06170 [Nitrosarchaeum sp.]|nr:hypothetical protein YTPLAS73_06170 [Nitrosarchaeum sp.]